METTNSHQLSPFELDIMAKSLDKLNQIIDEFYVKSGILLDDSHDADHALAVANNALGIFHALRDTKYGNSGSGYFGKFRDEINSQTHWYETMLIVTSMFHDSYDHKYITDETTIKAIKGQIAEFINTVIKEKIDQPNQPKLITNTDIVFDIIDNMSWSKGVYQRKNKITYVPLNQMLFEIVQDADRVEAIGPVGVRRNFLYTKHKICKGEEDYAVIRKYMIEHSKEKLVLIWSALNYQVSKKQWKDRHEFTVDILDKLEKEEETGIMNMRTWGFLN